MSLSTQSSARGSNYLHIGIGTGGGRVGGIYNMQSMLYSNSALARNS